MRFAVAAGLLLHLIGCTPAPGEGPPEGVIALHPGPDVEVVRLDSADAVRAAREIEQEVPVNVADGLELSLWASDRLLADPVALSIDNHGRVFVTQTTRSGETGLDLRRHRDWMIESISLRSVEDLRGFIHRTLSPERSEQNAWLQDHNGDGSRDWRDLTVLRERIHRIEDTSGDGVADLSWVVLEDFNTELSDAALGLLVRDGDLYVGVAPDLWRLRDTTGDGLMDYKESISHGYGTHIASFGHGISGITTGPDGRIYWEVGDIGMNVVDGEGRRWSYPDQGVVLRSEPDGSGFEVFASGIRNLGEFAFDEYGNLITVDNDGDHPGEYERLVYLVDGSDGGWRFNWQYGKYIDPLNNRYHVWMDEGLYQPRFEGQAAYIVPPLAPFHVGPTGMVYNPGTALSEEWRNHFFVSEYTGSPTTATIRAFEVRPQGAGFELVRDTVVTSGVLATGLDFGPDGALYIANWLTGWATQDGGRIWKLDAPGAADAPLRIETRDLLAADFAGRDAAALQRLLEHPDMRVRLKAQFELAERSNEASLLAAARQQDHQLARLHGLWGIGQLARRDAARAGALMQFLGDGDAEVRAQAAKVIGDVRHGPAASALIPLLEDPADRVRFFAAEALGRIGHAPAVPHLVTMVETNDDRDTYLRHAGSLALARIGNGEALAALAEHPSRAVRIAAVVALRRMRDPAVAAFLADAEEYVVVEAARAINDDGGITEALPALARLLDDPPFQSEPLLRRLISANSRVGTAEAANRVAAYAARTSAPEAMRVEALTTLGVWPAPSVMDRVDGVHLGAEQRDTALAAAAAEPLLPALLADGSATVRVAMAQAAGRLALTPAGPALLASLTDDTSPEVRVAALRALQAMGARELPEAMRLAAADGEVAVRNAALELLPEMDLPDAVRAELLASVLERGTIGEQQSALEALGRLQSSAALGVLTSALERLEEGRLAAEIELDLEEAIEASGAQPLAERLRRVRAKSAGGGMLAEYAAALRGGDAGRGRQIVFHNAAASCVRCHSVEGSGAEVGPPLEGVGGTLSRAQLVESLVDPSVRIAPGYGTGPSAMPPMGSILSRREIRDVVEYLATLR